MTIWILKAVHTPDEEADIVQRAELALPLGEVPDLSGVSNIAGLRRLLAAMQPDEPPETVAGRADRIWPLYHGVAVEDIIAVPLAGAREFVLAEVVGRYRYRVGESGEDMHLVPVKWHGKRVPFRALARYPELLAPDRPPMFEVENPKARILIRDRLPHAYNRFAKWKWLLALFFLMGLVRLFERLLH